MRTTTRQLECRAPPLGLVPCCPMACHGRFAPAGGYRLFVTFQDGTRGEVELSRLVTSDDAGFFEQLRDPAMFARVGVANGAVKCSERRRSRTRRMYDEIKKEAEGMSQYVILIEPDFGLSG